MKSLYLDNKLSFNYALSIAGVTKRRKRISHAHLI